MRGGRLVERWAMGGGQRSGEDAYPPRALSLNSLTHWSDARWSVSGEQSSMGGLRSVKKDELWAVGDRRWAVCEEQWANDDAQSARDKGEER